LNYSLIGKDGIGVIQADELTGYVAVLANLFEVAQHSSSEAVNLSKQECRVITVVGQRQPLIMREIAEHSGLSVTNTTGIVERLVRKGYLRRERSEQDRRIVCIQLTPDGTRIYDLEVENYRSVSAAILAALDLEERAEMLRMMHKVAERLA
jgi:DNA-binding MarR family transcriptional regulator